MLVHCCHFTFDLLSFHFRFTFSSLSNSFYFTFDYNFRFTIISLSIITLFSLSIHFQFTFDLLLFSFHFILLVHLRGGINCWEKKQPLWLRLFWARLPQRRSLRSALQMLQRCSVSLLRAQCSGPEHLLSL